MDCEYDDFFEDWIHGSDGEQEGAAVEDDGRPSEQHGVDVDSLFTRAQYLRKHISNVREKTDNYIEDLDKTIVGKLLMLVDVTEVYSPERVSKACAKIWLVQGSSMDISTSYDFDKPKKGTEQSEQSVRTSLGYS